MSTLKQDLLTAGTELIETHISWVFLRADAVWKLKKPVNFGFLDFSSVEKRHRACEAEVALNARLAPQVYRGVRPVTKTPAGSFQFGGSGEIVDWAVEMERLPSEQRADLLLERGALQAADVERLAERIAAFHASARVSPEIAAFASPEAILRNVTENFAQTRESVGEYLSQREAEGLEAGQRAFVEQHRELLEARVSAGRARDGHGDLRLEHVYLTDAQILIIDCIEFNERFRYGDVCADLAFLCMDLERLGRVDLAERLLARYARSSGDYQLYLLIDFYEGYRAYVRAKVSTLLARDSGAPLDVRQRAAKEARLYYLLALSAPREFLLKPALIAVGGIIGSGKSTLASLISEMTGAPSIEADRIRKSLLGVLPTHSVPDAAWSGAYAPEFSEKVYVELFARAAYVLRSGRLVVLDASFRSKDLRRRAVALAAEHGVPFWFVEATASADLCRERLRRRAEATSISDGRLEIYDEFVARWDPVDELEPAQHVVVDTARPIEQSEQRLHEALPSWPSGLNR